MDPTERKSLITADRPLRDGTKLALFRFDRPYPPVPVDIKLRFQIALGDEKRDDMHLRKTLSIIRALVEEAKVAYPPPA